MVDSRPSPTSSPLRRVGGSERRVNFVEHMGVVVGDEGKAALTEKGVAAHRVSSDLQGVARDNTPADAKRALRGKLRRRSLGLLLALLTVVGVVWIVDNAAGYANRSQGTTITRVVSTGATATVLLSDGRRVSADCFDAKPGVLVWKASAPAGSVLGYRCGNEPIDAELPGPVSAALAGAALVSAIALVALRARWRRKNAWY
jgi:hypothetical protein